MNYLFFDIECCDGAHICEFGYVLCDQGFNVIQRQTLLINPEEKFRLSARNDGSGLKLTFSHKEYYSSPKFPKRYQIIKNIIEAQGQLILGHSVKNDALFLKTACERYQKPILNFEFYDTQRIFSGMFSSVGALSLEKIAQELGIEILQNLHKSEDDAYLTMLVAKRLCETRGCGLVELLADFPTCRGESSADRVCYINETLESLLKQLQADENAVSKAKKERLFKIFLENYQSTTAKSEELKGVKVCVSSLYERAHFKKSVALVCEIYARGGKYTTNAFESNIFLKDDGVQVGEQPKNCARLTAALEKAKGKNKKFAIYTVDEFLAGLGVSEGALKDKPLPDKRYFKQQKRMQVQAEKANPYRH